MTNSFGYRLCSRRHAVLWAMRLVVFGLFVGLSGVSMAKESVVTPLSLSQALARALKMSPELALYPYDIRAAEARTLQAGLRPNPELSFEVENIAGTGDLSGIDAAETTLALSQVVELGGKRALRRDVGRYRRQSIERDYHLARLDVLSMVASRYLEVAQAQSLLKFVREIADYSKTAEDISRRRFNAGSSSRAELSRARTDLLQAKLAVSNLEVRLENAKRRLSSMWGEIDPDFDSVDADLFTLPPVPAYSEINAKLEHSPQLSRFLTLERLRKAELDLAAARGRQDITLGAGIKHIEDVGDVGLMLTFSMPLGVFDRNQGNITAARENLERLDLEKQSVRLKVFTELRNGFSQLEQARERVSVLNEQIIPETLNALTLIQNGYGEGRFSYLELLEARRQLLSFETEAVIAATDFHQTLITLETLTGQPFTKERQVLYGADDEYATSEQDQSQ